ncbi:MAG: prolipoprotein diacylglyceryl transferase [Planctomycetota bacterium]|jgi:phosphatidylglycerol:prolipoprotein diacylglycerol transferase
MFASPGAVAFEIGSFEIRWFGLIITAALILGTILAYREAVRRGRDPEPLVDIIIIAILAGLVGGRIYYVLLYWPHFAQDLMKILAVWEGGMGVLGAILGALLAVILYGKLKGLPVLPYCDICAPFAALAQAIGRWGTFFNEEAFGAPTDLPWKLYISPSNRPLQLQQYEYFHPTFLYESLWNLFIFAVLYFIFRKRLAQIPGALTCLYLGLYACGRFLIESIRVDSPLLGSLRTAQVLSVLFFLAAAGGLAYLRLKRRAE